MIIINYNFKYHITDIDVYGHALGADRHVSKCDKDTQWNDSQLWSLHGLTLVDLNKSWLERRPKMRILFPEFYRLVGSESVLKHWGSEFLVRIKRDRDANKQPMYLNVEVAQIGFWVMADLTSWLLSKLKCPLGYQYHWGIEKSRLTVNKTRHWLTDRDFKCKIFYTELRIFEHVKIQWRTDQSVNLPDSKWAFDRAPSTSNKNAIKKQTGTTVLVIKRN